MAKKRTFKKPRCITAVAHAQGKGKFKPGNTMWKGRDVSITINREFKTVAEFIQGWVDYFNYTDENPWQVTDVVKGGNNAGMLVDRPARIPYSIGGFQAYHNLGINYLSDMKDRYTAEDCKIKDADEFTRVIRWAENIIRHDKISGATIDVFNANIVARELQIADTINQAHTGIPDKTITQVEILKTVIKQDGK